MRTILLRYPEVGWLEKKADSWMNTARMENRSAEILYQR